VLRGGKGGQTDFNSHGGQRPPRGRGRTAGTGKKGAKTIEGKTAFSTGGLIAMDSVGGSVGWGGQGGLTPRPQWGGELGAREGGFLLWSRGICL